MLPTDDNKTEWVSITGQFSETENIDPTTLRNWGLVLSSRGIPFKSIPAKRPQEILVPTPHLAVACNEINLYQTENKATGRPALKKFDKADNMLATLSILLLLGIFHNLTYLQLSGFGHDSIDWLKLGSANNTLILNGEWWRLITSLTLHADWQHLLGNILLGGYFVVRLCQITGSSAGWFLVLCSGLIGNFLNALIQPGNHNAVGASTAIFGAIGIAGAIGSALAPRQQLRQWLLPLAAAFILLGLLGSGNNDNTDVGAHIFGFVAGIMIGFPTGFYLLTKGRPKGGGNFILMAVSLTLTLSAWLLALTSQPH